MGVARVIQQGHQELPELQGTSALVGRSLAKDAAALLLDLAWGGERPENGGWFDGQRGQRSTDTDWRSRMFTGHRIRCTHVWEHEKLG